MLLFTHKLNCLQTFEPISHHSLLLFMGSVYILIGVLNKLDVGVLLLFTNLSFCKNMEVVLDISACSLTSPNNKGADAAVYAVPKPHRTGMSIFQELTPYPRGYEYFPGSGQATNWLMYGCLGSTGFSLSR